MAHDCAIQFRILAARVATIHQCNLDLDKVIIGGSAFFNAYMHHSVVIVVENI